jgi:hypothetical protein
MIEEQRKFNDQDVWKYDHILGLLERDRTFQRSASMYLEKIMSNIKIYDLDNTNSETYELTGELLQQIVGGAGMQITSDPDPVGPGGYRLQALVASAGMGTIADDPNPVGPGG